MENVCCNHPKMQTKKSFHREMCPKDADGMANSVDPDLSRAVSSGSAPTCM